MNYAESHCAKLQSSLIEAQGGGGGKRLLAALAWGGFFFTWERGGRGIDQTDIPCDAGQFGGSPRSEFAHGATAMDFHGDQRQTDSFRDLFVQQAGKHQMDDLPFATGQ